MFRNIDDLIENQQVKVSKMKDFKKSILQKMLPKKARLYMSLDMMVLIRTDKKKD